MSDLQTIVIFGVGSMLLYVLVPVSLFANEVRLAKQSDDTSGTAAIFNSIMQAFFFIVAWSMFVSIIMFMVLKFSEKKYVSSGVSPAQAIGYYWNKDWIINETSQAIVSTSISAAQEKQAKLMVLIITWAKAIEYLLLGVLLALALKLSMSLPLLKMRRADHYKMSSHIDIGTLMSVFMTGIVGWVIYMAIMEFESTLLTSMAQVHPGSSKIDVLEGLKHLLQSGAKKL